MVSVKVSLHFGCTSLPTNSDLLFSWCCGTWVQGAKCKLDGRLGEPLKVSQAHTYYNANVEVLGVMTKPTQVSSQLGCSKCLSLCRQTNLESKEHRFSKLGGFKLLVQLSYFLADTAQVTLLPDEEMVPGNPQHRQNGLKMAYSQLPICHPLQVPIDDLHFCNPLWEQEKHCECLPSLMERQGYTN